jgi:hypothetical protein
MLLRDVRLPPNYVIYNEEYYTIRGHHSETLSPKYREGIEVQRPCHTPGGLALKQAFLQVSSIFPC